MILNSLERKVIILLGDITIIVSALNVFINEALDVKVESFFYRVLFYCAGVIFYLFLSYILDFYNLEKAIKKRTILSQSFFIVGLFVILVFIGTVLFFDASFWRIPLIIFLVLPPLQVFLWRYFFGNLFKVIPDVKKTLYIYDSASKKEKERYIDLINGGGVQTFYKIKLTYSLEDEKFLEKEKFQKALEKVDAFILNLHDYDKLPLELEKVLLRAILTGKEVIPFFSFYENVYEALPINSQNNSFREVLQLKYNKIRYFQALFTFLVNWLLIIIVGCVLLLRFTLCLRS